MCEPSIPVQNNENLFISLFRWSPTTVFSLEWIGSAHNAMHVAVQQLMVVDGVQDICAVKFHCVVLWNCSWVLLTSLISGRTCAQSWILMCKAWPESPGHSFSSFWFYLWDFKLLDEPLTFTRPLCWGSKQLHSYVSQRIVFKECQLAFLNWVSQGN